MRPAAPRLRPRSSTERYDIDLWRARALPAGAAILAEIQALLGVPLEVGTRRPPRGRVARAARPAPGRSGRRQVGLGPDVRGRRPRAPRSSPSCTAVPADELGDHVAVRARAPARPSSSSSSASSVARRSRPPPAPRAPRAARPSRFAARLEASRRSGRYGLETSRVAPSPLSVFDERLRLLAALLVERPQRVVADPASRSPARAWRTSSTRTLGSGRGEREHADVALVA